MQMDSSLILAGQTPDIMGSFSRGMEIKANENMLAQQDALANLYRTQGAQILSGDEGALNALAGFDPQAALGIKQTQQQMAYSAEDQQRQRENARLEAAQYARTVSAEEAAAVAAQTEADVKRALAAPDPATFDAMMAEMGKPEMAGQWANRQQLAIPYLEFADVLKVIAKEAPDMTASQKDYKFYADQEAAAGRQPLSFNEWDLQSKKAGATTVTVGGGPAPAEVAAFNKDVKSNNVNEVIGDIRATMSGATLPTTGVIGSALSGVGGTAAGDVKSNVETLKAAASFSSLQAMRDASKTGAALGAVSDTEIRLLGAELANLEQSQSQEQFLRNLERFERVYNEIVNGPQGGAPAAPGGAATEMSDEDFLKSLGIE
jgi:hypothetical protein